VRSIVKEPDLRGNLGALRNKCRELALDPLDHTGAPAFGHQPGRGSGKISSSPFSSPSKNPAPRTRGSPLVLAAFMSVPMGPRKTAWTVTPSPASSALSDCVKLDDAAFEME
jgi:hypothetical protein